METSIFKIDIKEYFCLIRDFPFTATAVLTKAEGDAVMSCVSKWYATKREHEDPMPRTSPEAGNRILSES
jgi:hypothetical protein